MVDVFVMIAFAAATCMVPGNHTAHADSFLSLLRALTTIASAISHELQHTLNFTSASTHNAFGDAQLGIDVRADKVVFDALRASGVVYVGSSEEKPQELVLNSKCGEHCYSVAFDPLDGSSIVDCNFAVGTIISVWSGKGLVGRVISDQLCSAVIQYGPRTSMMLAFVPQQRCTEFTLMDGEFYLSRERVTIQPTTKLFAPANLRAAADDANYQQLVQYYISNK